MRDLLTRYCRRGCRFSLRAMFAAITLFAVWLGRELHLVHERDRFVQSVENLRMFEHVPGQTTGKPLPWHWSMLGAKRIEYMEIVLPAEQYTVVDAVRMRAIYPELNVSLAPAGYRR